MQIRHLSGPNCKEILADLQQDMANLKQQQQQQMLQQQAMSKPEKKVQKRLYPDQGYTFSLGTEPHLANIPLFEPDQARIGTYMKFTDFFQNILEFCQPGATTYDQHLLFRRRPATIDEFCGATATSGGFATKTTPNLPAINEGPAANDDVISGFAATAGDTSATTIAAAILDFQPARLAHVAGEWFFGFATFFWFQLIFEKMF